MNNEPKSRPIQDEGEPDLRSIAHDLWYNGGRLKSELKDALCLHPEIWNIEGLQRMLDRWDECANRYASKVLLAKVPPLAAQPESQPAYEGSSFHKPGCPCYAPSGDLGDNEAECGRDCVRCTCLVFVDSRTPQETANPIRALVDEQAEDGGLWFVAETITEDYLQSALRKLHAVVEANLKIASPSSQVAAEKVPVPTLIREMLSHADTLTEKATVLHLWSLTLPDDEVGIYDFEDQVAGGVGEEEEILLKYRHSVYHASCVIKFPKTGLGDQRCEICKECDAMLKVDDSCKCSSPRVYGGSDGSLCANCGGREPFSVLKSEATNAKT